MTEILEITMMVCFGAAWPLNLYKGIKTRSTKGISPVFYALVLFGYIAGILSKFLNPTYMADFGTKWYVLIFYCFNLTMVALNLLVYFRNRAAEHVL